MTVIEYSHPHPSNEKITRVDTYANRAGEEIRSINYGAYSERYFMVCAGTGRLVQMTRADFMDCMGAYAHAKEEHYLN